MKNFFQKQEYQICALAIIAAYFIINIIIRTI